MMTVDDIYNLFLSSGQSQWLACLKAPVTTGNGKGCFNLSSYLTKKKDEKER